MATQEIIAFTTDEKIVMAKVAFRQVQINGRGEDIAQHELEDAKYYVDMAIAYIKARNSYNPEQYARDAAQGVIIEYVKVMLQGRQPSLDPYFNHIYDMWLKAAAQERYSGRPDSWPDYPNVRQRLRTHDYKTFDPDGQTSSDF